MDKISVIIPYYNSEDYIIDTLHSLDQQEYKDFEVILINDHSNDQSETLIQNWIKDKNLNIKHLYNEENAGVAYSRNRGLEYASGEWIYFLDADDTISPFTLKYMYEHTEGLDGVIAPMNKFTVKKVERISEVELETETMSNETNPNAFLRRNTVCGILYKKSIIDEHQIKFNEKLRLYSDYAFSVEYQKHVNAFIKIKNNGFYYRGEVYDPFNKPNLSKSEFNLMFNYYVKGYFYARTVADDIRVKRFLDKKMMGRIKRYFNPDLRQIEQRYKQHAKTLNKIFYVMDKKSYKQSGLLMKREIRLLKKKQYAKAYELNKFRKQSRIYRRLLLNKKSRARSLYDLNLHKKAINDKQIVFESFAGKSYSDSPKYIYEYMYKNYPDYTYIWVLNHPDKFDIPGPAKKVKRLSKEFYEAYATSKYWVANARIPLYLIKKPGQVYLQTWHGTPLKRLGNDMKVVRMPGTTTPAYKYNFKKETERWDYLVSPNKYSSEIFKSAFWMDQERLLETGYPRNDILTTKQNDQSFIDNLKQKIGIPEDKNVIMYAPTWRDDEFIKKGKYKFELKIDLENLQNTIGRDSVILLRMHYLIASALDISEFEGFAYDVSSYPDISELYLISDLLITDYSSVFFDYSILKRPTVFFSYDIDKYKDDLRGFYLDYYKDLPGPIYTDAYSLAMALKDIDVLALKYSNNISTFHDRFNAWESGTSSKQVISKVINNK
ncbi:CDP-glycerol:glycerophosphate glycerophosphotransferase [Macrococcoides caseolyticum]|uniref:bifunctional glycosyltransferase/CDP-glycerol:glycerophosphate glycerophosphotransferase n=1 Tax=Macrococcoides caseolyticum TaxID=69966 RepID=UPI001C5E7302|nr:CDP-glycerol:glycerophosphate glycerophosphotransferase [Macrococcus caseolyticus]QYA40723.1 CDP-glycerol:glycerophosphate glycerophosphotransferase [Macrococcus caseolyticus]